MEEYKQIAQYIGLRLQRICANDIINGVLIKTIIHVKIGKEVMVYMIA